MNKNKKFILIIVVVFICAIFSRINIFAGNIKEASPETLAVTLVIDNSGSMATTDTQKLRETAANIFIDLLSPNDYLSIITFNTKAEVVLPMQKIQSSDNKNNFKKKLSQKIQATGDTDYLLALNEASKQLSTINNGNLRKVIVFLTDGEPDPDNTKKNDPVFMNLYMNSLWKEVSNLAINKYNVYSIGFSKGVDSTILEKISSSTQGTMKISDDSSELALSFFDILGNLKNRKNLLNETFKLKESSNLEFDLDEYTSQATMVFTNLDGVPFDVTLSAPDGKSTKDIININKSDKYNIITINQENEKLTGKWKVNLTGNGNIRAFGNKDLFIKSWLVSPELNSLHPINEPLDISVDITGEFSDNVSMEATITKDGVQDETPVKLEFKDGSFKGIYKNVNIIGKYDVEIRLMINGQVVTNNNTSLFVKELPSIYTDFGGGNINYRLDENLIVTSSLNIDGNKLLKSDDLKIENYNLLINYVNSGAETIPLLDNGSTNNGDTKENDGICSNKVLFNKEEGGSTSIIVSGTYKGEAFILQKYLGNFNVYPPGNILIKPLSTNVYTSSNNVLKIPIEIVNTSNFTETMIINIDEDIGKLVYDRIKIEPLKKINTNIYVNLDENLEKKIYDIKVKLTAENTQTKVEPAEFNTEVQVLSKTGYVLRYLKDNIIFIISFLGTFVGLLLFMILLGLLFYRILVHRHTIIQGKLSYWKESDFESKDKKEFDFNKLCKEKIVITYNEENKNAEFYIFDSKYTYDIELIAIADKSKWKFVDGYKALFHRNSFSELLLKTNEPGIFIYEDKIFTSKKIYKNDKFITGGYIFQYIVDDKKKSNNKEKGKNVLEEKYMFLMFKSNDKN